MRAGAAPGGGDTRGRGGRCGPGLLEAVAAGGGVGVAGRFLGWWAWGVPTARLGAEPASPTCVVGQVLARGAEEGGLREGEELGSSTRAS